MLPTETSYILYVDILEDFVSRNHIVCASFLANILVSSSALWDSDLVESHKMKLHTSESLGLNFSADSLATGPEIRGHVQQRLQLTESGINLPSPPPGLSNHIQRLEKQKAKGS